MTFLIAAMLLSVVPVTGPVKESVDQCERNFFYDENGAHVFTQLIFRDWNERCGEFCIVDWRMVKDQYAHPSGRIVMIDGEQLRDIQCTTIVESWTQYDPELHERSRWPKDLRRGLK